MATGIPADGFVSKPFDLTLLVDTLAEHTRQNP
jgi:hypothetical protein